MSKFDDVLVAEGLKEDFEFANQYQFQLVVVDQEEYPGRMIEIKKFSIEKNFILVADSKIKKRIAQNDTMM